MLANHGSKKNQEDDLLFLSTKGTEMESSELARITRSHVGGHVQDMRIAQYHLVFSLFLCLCLYESLCTILVFQAESSGNLSDAEFTSLAKHMNHSHATAKKSYAIMRPTKDSLIASSMMSRNTNR